MENKENNLKKYRWFFTKSGKIVYGGKSAEQNEEVVRELIKNSRVNKVVMHTSLPGSPFAVIDSPSEKINASDLEECAVWCGCFSRAWRESKKETKVDVFNSRDIFKDSKMKIGTFGVLNKSKNVKVILELVLTKQKGILRAVPEKTVKSKNEIYGKIKPGKTPKETISDEISKRLNIKKDEVLNALPTGGFSLKWD